MDIVAKGLELATAESAKLRKRIAELETAIRAILVAMDEPVGSGSSSRVHDAIEDAEAILNKR